MTIDGFYKKKNFLVRLGEMKNHNDDDVTAPDGVLLWALLPFIHALRTE